MPEYINQHRRRFLATATIAVAALELGMTGEASAKVASTASTETPTIKPGSHTTLGDIKQIDAGLLNIGYAEMGPAQGTAVVLLHGWPYDIHSFVDVAPMLAAKGYRVIVPHMRGHGSTRFLSDATVRNGQQAAVAQDIVALMDALNIDKAILGGFDWGARTANIIAALWPERCKAMVSVNGYLISNPERSKMPLSPLAEQAGWYQFYLATERGQAGLDANRRELANLIWKAHSPKWSFGKATFDRTADSFENPDYVAIVTHTYRWRLSLAPGEAQYDEIEQRLASTPVITVPTITLDGDADGISPATDGRVHANMFSGKRVHRIIAGVGHDLPQEAPQDFVDAVVDVDGYATGAS
ncbi:alpha/beta fold hydrolase [Pseudomonas huanghezhanensis]|uniref:alpha/beta fold hydrolase n=1 Tax=Pseudomonas huanghezhanensis TaxID=3002903 RepID=UPI002285C252|nr:alpha/beta hydrolase [Pseudomonas sp. BSw22131]